MFSLLDHLAPAGLGGLRLLGDANRVTLALVRALRSAVIVL